MRTILILLASATFGACTETTIHVTAGQDVLLQCNCPQNKGSPYLVWQIGDNTIVDQYIPGFNKSNISAKFRGRTRLFFPEDMGNCSLLLTNVTTEDKEKYTCYYYNDPIYSQADVTLVVSALPLGLPLAQPTSSPPSEPGKNGVSWKNGAIGGVVLVIVLLSIVFLTVGYRKRRRRGNVRVTGPPEGEQMEPLNTILV